jgi:hypothetical protein
MRDKRGMTNKRAKSSLIRASSLLLLFFWPAIAFAQGGNLGSNSSPVVNSQGRPMANVNIAVCQPMIITSASVTSNIAVLNTSANPVTAGFAAGTALMITGFTGADTYLNAGTLVNGQIAGGWTILSVTSSTITFQLIHANATTSTTGLALQEGNTSTSCGGLVNVYQDPGLTTLTANPFQSDTLGNWNVFAGPGTYYVQFYGPAVIATIREIVVNGGGGGSGSLVYINGTLSTSPSFNNSTNVALTLLGSNVTFSLSGVPFLSGSNTFTGSNSFSNNPTLAGNPALSVTGSVTPGDCTSFASSTTAQDAGAPCGSGGGGSPSGNVGDIQTKAGSSSFGASHINDTGSALNASETFNTAGPNPWIDTGFFTYLGTNYSMRGVTSVPTTTASCTGTATCTFTSTTGFQVGDGVTIQQAGATNTLSTPAAPTVTPVGQSGPDPRNDAVASVTGSTTYEYCIFASDIARGLTACSPTTTISTGNATLGMQTATISSWSASNNVVTVNTSASTPLKAGMIIFISGTGESTLDDGEFVVATTPTGSQFTFLRNEDTRNSPLVTSGSAGSVEYNLGNQVVIPTTAYQYYVCNVLTNAVYPVPPGEKTWTDYGSPMTAAPTAPSWLPSSCPSSATNDELSTTITNISGTSVTLATSSSQTVSGVQAIFDDGPVLRNAELAAATVGAVHISTPCSGCSYYINSVTTLGGVADNNFLQNGPIVLNDTMRVPSDTIWTGMLNGAACVSPQFGFGCFPTITVNTAYPGIRWVTNDQISNITVSYPSNGIAMVQISDGYGGYNLNMKNINCIGGASDYTGQCYIGYGMEHSEVKNFLMSTADGGGYGYSFSPVFLLRNDPALSNGSGQVTFTNPYCVGRGIGRSNEELLGAGGDTYIVHPYCQALRTPLMEVGPTNGGMYVEVDDFSNDTSLMAAIANFSAGNSMAAKVNYYGGSAAPVITGNPIYGAEVRNLWQGIAPGTNSNAFYDENQNTFSLPVLSPYGGGNPVTTTGYKFAAALHQPPLFNYYIDMLPPTGVTATVGSGGSIPVGTWYYAIIAIGYDGGTTKLSLPSSACVTTSGNQTCSVSWNPVVGAKEYSVFREQGSGGYTGAQAPCHNIVTTSCVDTSVSGGNGVPPSVTGTGTTSVVYNEVVTPQVVFTSALNSNPISYSGTMAPGTLSANRTYTLPDSSGTLCTTVTCPGTGNVTNSGTQVQGSPEIASNATNGIASSPAYLDCSQFSGADWGLIAQNCLSALKTVNANAGIADMRGVPASTTASVNPFGGANIPASGNLLLGPGTYQTNVPIVDANGWSITGESVLSVTSTTGTTIQASSSFQPTYTTGTITVGTAGANETITGSGTTWTSAMVGCAFYGANGGANSTFGIIKSVGSSTSLTLGWGQNVGSGASGGSSYSIACPLHAHGGGASTSSGDQSGMASINLGYDCNNIAGCIADLDWYGNQGTYDDNVILRGYTNIGFDLEWQFQQSGPWQRMTINPGSSCTANTVNVIVRGNLQSFYGLTGISQGKGTCSTSPAAGISVGNPGTNLSYIDSENLTLGIGLGLGTTCPISCAVLENSPNNSTVTHAWVSSSTTNVKIGNADGNTGQIVLQDLHLNGGTNNLVDQVAGCTSTITRLSQYVTGANGITVASSDPTCPIAQTTYAFAVKSSNYTLAYADEQIHVTGGPTITIPHALPSTTGIKRWSIINDGTTSATLQCDSGNINGAATATLPANLGSWVSADGTNCFAITGQGSGGFTNPMTTLGDTIYGGSSGTATRLAGPTSPNGVASYFCDIPSSGAAVAPTWCLAGNPPRANTTTSDTIAATDRGGYITESNASAIAVTVPVASTSGFGSGFSFSTCDIGAGTATYTPTTSTISYSKNGTYTSAASSLALTTGQCAYWYTDGTNYFAVVVAAGSGSGTINNAAQYDVPYYSVTGTANTLSGAAISGFQYDSTSGAPAAATAAQAATLIQGLPGCNTATYVFTPQASDCVAPSSGSGTVTSVSAPVEYTVTNPTTTPAIVWANPNTAANIDPFSPYVTWPNTRVTRRISTDATSAWDRDGEAASEAGTGCGSNGTNAATASAPLSCEDSTGATIDTPAGLTGDSTSTIVGNGAIHRTGRTHGMMGQTAGSLTAITNVRMFRGYTNLTIAGQVAPGGGAGSDVPTGQYAGIMFSTTGTYTGLTDTTHFVCVVDNGTTQNAVSTGVSADTSFHYFAFWEDVTNSKWHFYIDNAEVCGTGISTDIPSSGTNLAYSEALMNLTAANVGLNTAWVVTQDDK